MFSKRYNVNIKTSNDGDRYFCFLGIKKAPEGAVWLAY